MKILLTENQLKKLVTLINEDNNQKNVMFVGDSNSAGPGWTWNYQLEKEHPDWNVTHITQVGKRTDWMLDRLTNELTKKKYDLVFIYGGMNDISSGFKSETPINNIQKMVNEVVNQGGKAIVLTGFDQQTVFNPTKIKPTANCGRKCYEQVKQKRIDYQKKLEQSITNATIIPKLVGDETWATDGIHVGPSKHKLMKDLVTKNLSQGKTTTNTNQQESELMTFFENYFKFLDKKIVVDQNSNPNDIKRMQIILFLIGNLGTGVFSGTMDRETNENVKKFQMKNGLPTTGKFDIQTQQMFAKKIIPNYTFDSEETTTLGDINTIKNPGIKVKSLPSNLEGMFRKIPGVNFDKFKSEVESIGIPVKLAIRQLYLESGFSPDVIACKRKSSAGAMGIAQFMPGTWPSYGKGGDPCNVSDALSAYVRYMGDLSKKFPGRPDLMFVGYNWGPNRTILKKALADKTPLTSLKDKIPAESYGYSATILQ